MFAFDEYISALNFLHEAQIELDESGIGQFVDKIHKGVPCAVLTSDRHENGSKRNKSQEELLKKYILSKGFGFMPVLGSYIERDDETGKEERKDENSFVIYTTKDRERELRNVAFGLGKFFKQESILFRDSKGDANLIFTKENKKEGIHIGDTAKLGKFNPKKVGDFFTELKDKRNISYASAKFDPKTMDKCYYVSYSKTKPKEDDEYRSVGRNNEGKKAMMDIIKKNPKVYHTVKALWKGTNNVIYELKPNQLF